MKKQSVAKPIVSALVVALMCFSASYRVAVIAGVIWLAILFAAYQITQAKR